MYLKRIRFEKSFHQWHFTYISRLVTKLAKTWRKNFHKKRERWCNFSLNNSIKHIARCECLAKMWRSENRCVVNWRFLLGNVHHTSHFYWSYIKVIPVAHNDYYHIDYVQWFESMLIAEEIVNAIINQNYFGDLFWNT